MLCLLYSWSSSRAYKRAVPSHFGTRDQFRGEQFFHEPGVGSGWGAMVVSGYFKRLHVLCIFISTLRSTSDHQIPEVEDPCCIGCDWFLVSWGIGKRVWVAWAYPAKPVHRFLPSILDSACCFQSGIQAGRAFSALAHNPEGLAAASVASPALSTDEPSGRLGLGSGR